jgi:hypothetical protein
MNATDEERLKELNWQTFVAETRKQINEEPWDKFLWSVLAEDFQLKRSNDSILPQDKARMIAHIQYAGNTAERLVSDVEVFQRGPYGVVSSTVRLQGQPAEYYNLKVFVNAAVSNTSVVLPPDWKCVYWRVSKAKTSP